MSGSRGSRGSLDPESEFPIIDGTAYIRVDGYFSSDTKTKISFPTSEGYMYYVEHVVDPQSLDESVARAYYREISAGTVFHAIFTSTNVVKKMKKK